MKTYSLPFGKGEQQISLDETHILYDLHGNHVKAVSDEAAAVRKALRQPIDSLPLADVVAPGDTVAIIVSDITRPVHTAQMLPVIVNELNLAGIPDEQIKVVTAQGTHRAHTPEEDELVCGKEMVRRLTIINHDCRDKENLLKVGTRRTAMRYGLMPKPFGPIRLS